MIIAQCKNYKSNGLRKMDFRHGVCYDETVYIMSFEQRREK